MAATNVSEKVPLADFEGYTSEGENTSTRRGLSIDPKTKAAGCLGSKEGRNVLSHLVFEGSKLRKDRKSRRKKSSIRTVLCDCRVSSHAR